MTATRISLSRYGRTGLLCASILFFTCECLGLPSISISPRSGPPTSNILVSGEGFRPNHAVDIYFDTTDKALALTDSLGAFSKIAILAPAAAVPGTHWVSAVERSGHTGAQVPFVVNTNWNQFHFAPDHIGFNPHENVLSPTTVGGMGLNWSFPTVGQVELSPAEANGVVYVGAGFQVSALNARTGTLLWQFTAGNFVGSPAVSDGRVYVSSADQNIYALNARTGAVLWTYQTLPGIPAPTLTVANRMVYVGSWDKNLYALNAQTGSLVWQYTAGGSILSIPAVSNNVVYFGAGNATLYALNATTGSLLWQFSLPFFVDASPTVVNGVVYVGSGDKNVYALNASNGALLWQYATDSFERTSPAVVNGIVYVTSDGGFVYALSAYTGKLVWKYDTGSGDDGFPPSSPSVANGVVYAGFQDGKVYALDAARGGLMWQYVTGNAVSSTPVVANGMVFAGSWDNNVYAFGITARDETRRPELGALRSNMRLKPSKPAADLPGTRD